MAKKRNMKDYNEGKYLSDMEWVTDKDEKRTINTSIQLILMSRGYQRKKARVYCHIHSRRKIVPGLWRRI